MLGTALILGIPEFNAVGLPLAVTDGPELVVTDGPELATADGFKLGIELGAWLGIAVGIPEYVTVGIVLGDTDASTEDEDCNGDPGGAGEARRREFKPTLLKALPGCVTCTTAFPHPRTP